MVETVGRAIPCFRHGTDYILNLSVVSQVPWRLMRNIFLLEKSSRVSHPSTTLKAAYESIHGWWIAPHTARDCLTTIIVA